MRSQITRARHVHATAEVSLRAARVFWRRPGVRAGTAHGVAAAVAGILYGASGAAVAQEAVATKSGESLQEIVVTASANA